MTDDRVAELYRAHGPAVYARCRRLLGEVQAAEDATQETFLRVHRHLDRAPDVREALRWIYRIATNYCLNEIRNRRHRPRPTDRLPEVAAGGEQWMADLALARRIVERVPAPLRAVAWLYHVDGLEQAEVAQVLGISRRTVVNRLAAFGVRARKLMGSPRTGA
jgi:RNA polymerase sigma-70 factor (ECF subfamily)